MLNTATLLALSPATKPYIPGLIQAARRYGIVTSLQQAHWLAQIGAESKGFTSVRESLNYSVQGLLATFGRHRISEDDARRYGRIDKMIGGKKVTTQHAAQRAIAICIYGGEWGRENLGNLTDEDAINYIGRSLKHVTGLDNYRACSRALFQDERLVLHPELLEDPINAAMAAGWFWSSKALNSWADRDNLLAISRAVNLGHATSKSTPNGMEQRKAWLAKSKRVLALPV